MWVLKPGKTFVLRGFYLSDKDEKNLAPFKVLVGDEAKQKRTELGDKAGEILLNVFETAEAPMGEKLVISRSLRIPPTSDATARRDLPTLQRNLMKVAAVKRVERVVEEDGKVFKREMIVRDEDEANRLTESLASVDFPHTSVPVASKALKIVPKPSE
jgi:hypothetical protein